MDMVNSPSHYTQRSMEAIDIIKNSLTEEEYKGYLKGTAMKYQLRCEYKGKFKEDLNKSIWYINRLIKEFGGINA